MTPLRALLTTAQAAHALGIRPSSVRKLVERGKLRASTFGNALAFAPADVERAKSRPARGRPARKNFRELRAKMSPESIKRSEEKTRQIQNSLRG